MQRVHSLLLSEWLNENRDEAPQIRAALAGGSDHRPPDDRPRPAQVIRFPIERTRPSALRRERDPDALWPAWMSGILNRRDGPLAAPEESGPGLMA